MQQFLNQSKGAEPSADRTAKDQPVEHENTEHIEADLLVAGADGVLQRAERTCPDCAGTGIAIEPRNTDSFGCRGFALIDFPLQEAPEMGVIEQGTVELDEPSLGRPMGSPPGSFHIIQGQHTPYKF